MAVSVEYVMNAMPNPPLAEGQRAFLDQELERFLSLYSETQASIQSVFNFYLTFATTVVGALIVLLQVVDVVTVTVHLTLIALLGFAVMVGSVYMSALVGRYAHAARYAQAVDALRHYLIGRLQVPLPPLYDAFLKPAPPSASSSAVLWLSPVGTYQMFIAFINSLCLALVVWLVGAIGGVVGLALAASILTAFITFFIQNAYAHLMARSSLQRLHVRIYTGQTLGWWTGRN